MRQYDDKVQTKTSALRTEWEQVKRTRETEQSRLSRWQSQLEAQHLQLQHRAEEFDRESERATAQHRDTVAKEEQARKDKYREMMLGIKKTQDELDAREQAIQETEFQRTMRDKDSETALRDRTERLTADLQRQIDAYQIKASALQDERAHFERERKAWTSDFEDRKRRVEALEVKLGDKDVYVADARRAMESERRALDELKAELDRRESDLRIQTKTTTDDMRLAKQRLLGSSVFALKLSCCVCV